MFQEFITSKVFFSNLWCAENISYQKLNPQQMSRKCSKQNSSTSSGCCKDINFYLRVNTKTYTKWSNSLNCSSTLFVQKPFTTPLDINV